MSVRRKVLFAGYEFEQTIQRGIYLYTKSLIHAIHENGYETGILSQSKNSNDNVLLTQIYHSLRGEVEHSHKKIALQYLKTLMGFYKEKIIKNQERMFTEEEFWYLKDIDYFVNIPMYYRMTGLALHMPGKLNIFPSDLKSLGPNDILFSTSPLNFKTKKHKLVQTIHDMIPMNITIHSENPSFFYTRLKACAQADKLLAVSEFTRQQFLEQFPQAHDRIKVVYQPLPADENAIYLSSLPKVQEAVLKKYNLKSKQYMYYVGAIEARKNIHRLIQAYELSTKSNIERPLVLSGGIDKEYIQKTKISKYFDEKSNGLKGQGSGGRHNIIKTDYVTEVEKLCLIRNARAFLFPTLNEGFGIPVLEAQTLGAPVLTCNNSSLPEVVGDSALMVEDAFNIEEIATNIERLWVDDDLCADLSVRGMENAKRFSKENFRKNIATFLDEGL